MAIAAQHLRRRTDDQRLTAGDKIELGLAADAFVIGGFRLNGHGQGLGGGRDISMDQQRPTGSQPAGGFYGVESQLMLQEFEANKGIPLAKPLT